MSSLFKCISLTGLLCGLAPVAMADDLNPPPWRGTLGSTFQHWGFNQPAVGAPQAPDSGFLQNPGLGQMPLFFPGNSQWLTGWEGRNGVICLTPGVPIRFVIPNPAGPPPMTKEIWVQMTWWSGLPNSQVVLPTGAHIDPGTVVTNPLGGGWNHTTATWNLDFCPPEEDVVITNLTTANVYLDQVVIDTRCVPEPASFAALGLGAAALLRRGRRRI